MSLDQTMQRLVSQQRAALALIGRSLDLTSDVLLESCASNLAKIAKGEEGPVSEEQRKSALAESDLYMAALDFKRAFAHWSNTPCACAKCVERRAQERG